MRIQKKAIPFYLATIAYAIFIYYLSSLSQQSMGDGGLESPISDKLYHLAEYFVLGVLLFCSIYLTKFSYNRFKGLNKPKEMLDSLFALIIGSLYGISDELHQFFVPHRNSDPFDAIFDGIGVAIGIIIMLLVLKWSRTVAVRKQINDHQLDTGKNEPCENMDNKNGQDDEDHGNSAERLV